MLLRNLQGPSGQAPCEGAHRRGRPRSSRGSGCRVLSGPRGSPHTVALASPHPGTAAVRDAESRRTLHKKAGVRDPLRRPGGLRGHAPAPTCGSPEGARIRMESGRPLGPLTSCAVRLAMTWTWVRHQHGYGTEEPSGDWTSRSAGSCYPEFIFEERPRRHRPCRRRRRAAGPACQPRRNPCSYTDTQRGSASCSSDGRASCRRT